MSTILMNLLVYASQKKQHQRLLQALNGCDHRCALETFMTLRSLGQRLRRNCGGETWLVLVTQSPPELARLSALSDLILNTRSILVLPDHRRESAILGHTLYPRFISYLDSDFSDVGSVLETVLARITAGREDRTHPSRGPVPEKAGFGNDLITRIARLHGHEN
ncbi:hypothetical protein [Desulfosarcina sp.]|uniref:hypothetical protein n=1 Tax=Desulfosarcina sp. TaxID=2027861 RepID=UPI00397083F8